MRPAAPQLYTALIQSERAMLTSQSYIPRHVYITPTPRSHLKRSLSLLQIGEHSLGLLFLLSAPQTWPHLFHLGHQVREAIGYHLLPRQSLHFEIVDSAHVSKQCIHPKGSINKSLLETCRYLFLQPPENDVRLMDVIRINDGKEFSVDVG